MAADDALWAARMRALAAFAPGYFHDLKGPLNTIVLRLELLRATPAGDTADEKRRASVTAIEEQVRRLDRMLHGWLIATAPLPEAGCDLRALLQDATALAAPAARKLRVELNVVLPEAAVPVRGSATNLATAILDLLRHGLASYENGGALAIELAVHGGSARLVVRGAVFDAAATALAARIIDGAGGTCTLTNDPNGSAVQLSFPIAADV